MYRQEQNVYAYQAYIYVVGYCRPIFSVSIGALYQGGGGGVAPFVTLPASLYKATRPSYRTQ